MKTHAIFFDRDGTLIEEVGFLSRIDQLRLLPGASAAVRRVNQAQLPAIVITNQSGIARGFLTEADLAQIHAHLRTLFEREGARLDDIYHCPHYPRGEVARYARPCQCRKPAPGLLRRAADDHDLRLEGSVMIGDSLRDVEAGRRAGAEGVLVTSGYGVEEARRLSGGKDSANLPSPSFIASDILQAVDWALKQVTK